jgi:hypothetical protein
MSIARWICDARDARLEPFSGGGWHCEEWRTVDANCSLRARAAVASVVARAPEARHAESAVSLP